MAASASIRAVRAALLLLALVPPAVAQSTLVDESSVVVTESGLFLVNPGAPALLALQPAAFGLPQLVEPSVVWLEGSNRFLLTSRAVAGLGRLWRVQMQPNGTASLEDLGATAPGGGVGDLADVAYSVGLDTAFLLDRFSGKILVLKEPATASAALIEEWAQATPGKGLALDVNGARWPFGVVLVEQGGRVLRYAKSGVQTMHDMGWPWSSVTCNPATGEWVGASAANGLVGVVGGPTAMVAIDFNAYGFCGNIALNPADVEWDAYARRAVVLAEGGAICAFGGVATGPNHIVRLPLTAGGGPASNVPVLLSFPGPSGIFGAHPDLAYVRHETSDITWHGAAGTSGAGKPPRFASGGYGYSLLVGKSPTVAVVDAPPSAAAWLLLGLQPLFAPFQGQVLAPAPGLLLPALTDAAGVAALNLAVPNDPALLGVLVIAQWWIDDTTTPGAGDLVSSHAGLFTIGTK